MVKRWRKLMTISHIQHNTHLSHIAVTVCFLFKGPFTFCQHHVIDTRRRPKGNVNSAVQQWSIRTQSQMKTELIPCWLNFRWRCVPWIHQCTTGKAKERETTTESKKVDGWLLCYLKSSWLVVESALLWFHVTFSPEASDLRQLTVYSSPG